MSTGKLFLALCVALSLALPARAQESITGRGLSLKELGGGEITVDALVSAANKPVLLFFWTSWCPFCMKELKGLGAKQKELGQAVEIIAVNAGENKPTVERAMRSNNLQARMLLDERQQTVEALGIIGVPTFVLIDPKGAILFKDNFFPEQQVKELTGK